MTKRKKIIAAAILLAGVGAGSPVIPAGEMQLLYVNQYQAPREECRSVTATSTGKTSTECSTPAGPGFSDDDGNGLISVAFFRDSEGNVHKERVSDEAYRTMGLPDGQRFNPKKQEVKSLASMLLPKTANAAIALDAATGADCDPTCTSSTFSHTMGTGNTLLVVGGRTNKLVAGECLDSVTYNGNAMTLHDSQLLGNSGRDYNYLYYTAGPASGAHNVVVSGATCRAIYFRSVSYTGAAQTGIPDASAKASSASGTSQTCTLTTVADNSWMVAIFDNEVNTQTAGANTTIRGGFTSQSLADTNAAQTPAGSHSMSVSWSGSGENGYICFSFAPPGAAGAGGQLEDDDGSYLIGI